MRRLLALFLLAAAACHAQITMTGNITVKGDGVGIAAGPIASPGTPINLYPAASASNIPGSVTLTWGNNGGATSWDVYFGTSSSPPLVSSGQTTQSYATSAAYSTSASSLTTYYWKIVAHNAFGQAATGVQSFTTMFPYPVDYYMSLNFPSSGVNVGGVSLPQTSATLITNASEHNIGTWTANVTAPANLFSTSYSSSMVQITLVGNTNWGAIGDPNGTPEIGDQFTVTGTGSGNGTAVLYQATTSSTYNGLYAYYNYSSGTTYYSGSGHNTSFQVQANQWNLLWLNTFGAQYTQMVWAFNFEFVGSLSGSNQDAIDCSYFLTTGDSLVFTTTSGSSQLFHLEENSGSGHTTVSSPNIAGTGSANVPYRICTQLGNHGTNYTVSSASNQMTAGLEYCINTVGTANWTSLGASSAAQGVFFVYNGVAATGSGGVADAVDDIWVWNNSTNAYIGHSPVDVAIPAASFPVAWLAWNSGTGVGQQYVGTASNPWKGYRMGRVDQHTAGSEPNGTPQIVYGEFGIETTTFAAPMGP
jgi:hypothetical protein